MSEEPRWSGCSCSVQSRGGTRFSPSSFQLFFSPVVKGGVVEKFEPTN